MRRSPAKVVLVAALAVILIMGLTAAALAAPGGNAGKPRPNQGSLPSQASPQNQGSPQVPVVHRVIPDSGPATGGARVIILGSGFQDVTGVDFGVEPAASYEVRSPRVIMAVSPAGTAGDTVDVTVTTSEGTSATGEADEYNYEAVAAPAVRQVAPNRGPATGDARVMIIGSGFQGVTSVDFGAAPAGSYDVLSTHVIVVVSPAGTAGETVDVTVTTSMGTSPTSSVDQYTYKAPSL